MRHTQTSRARTFFAPLIATLMLALSLVVMSGPAASANDTCSAAGYTTINGSSGSVGSVGDPEDFGYFNWDSDSISYTVFAGYTLELCLKAGSDNGGDNGAAGGLRTTTVAGPAASTWDPDFLAGTGKTHEAGTSHVGYRYTYDHCPNMAGDQPAGTTCDVPKTPVDVSVTFTDNACVQNTYVPLVFTADDFAGTTKSVTGVAGPGETVTVVYTPDATHTINGAAADGTKTFSHTYPAQPDAQADCDAPPPGCPADQMDWNGPNVPGCGTPPPPPDCPAGQMDWNGPNVPGCGNPPPPPSPIQLTENVEGCSLAGIGFPDSHGTAVRTGEQEYILVGTQYVLEPLSDVEWSAWTVTEYTDTEYFDTCASGQPDPIIREVAGVQTDCEMNGTTYTIETFTTAYVWDTEALGWVLGPETGPVVTTEFIPFGGEVPDECVEDEPEVKGDQGEVVDHELPEVKGEQTVAPGVPTVVHAGIGTDESPLGSGRNPLWLLAVGGGLGLMGSAGLRRRATATR